MKESIRFKLESVRDRFEEIAGLLADPDVIADQNQFRNLSKEYARVEPVVQSFQKYEGVLEDIAAAEEMANDSDPEVREMGQEELAGLEERREALLVDLQKALIPPDPYDDSNVYLEIRAGTGGDGHHTVNISTAVAIVVAACGVPVAKHGNRSVSSKCGSADVLEACGVRLEVPARQARRCLDEAGICFLFAPNHQPAMVRIQPIRKQLGRRTIFNLMGPLSNPVGIKRQLIGIARPGYVSISQ